MQNIFLSFIVALQILTLDDWTKVIRTHSWWTGLIVLIYILVVNHLLMNAIIAQVFSQIDKKDNKDKKEKKGVESNREQNDNEG